MGLVFAKNKLPNSCEIFVEFTPFCKQSNALDPYLISQLDKIISKFTIVSFFHSTILNEYFVKSLCKGYEQGCILLNYLSVISSKFIQKFAQNANILL